MTAACRVARIGLAVLVLLPLLAAAQERSPADHAKDVFALLNKGDFKAVVSQFNGQMAAGLSESQLRGAWTAMQQQTGPFKAFIDERVSTPSPGVTGVLIGCRFELADANMAVAFDADGKIAGLRLIPRQ